MRPPQDSLDRLPKWARDYIQVLEIQVRDEKRQREAINLGKTRVSYEPNINERVYIPHMSVARFEINDRQHVDASLVARYGRGEANVVRISAGGNLTAPLIVLPLASNCALVTAEPWGRDVTELEPLRT